MTEKELSSSSEDYLEALYFLNEEKDEVSVSDIASFLGVKNPSVSEMMKKLREKKLVDYEKYGKITLTSQGEEIAEEVAKRHEDIVVFLQLLDVDEESARTDACKIEHVVGQNTMEKLRKFLKFVKESPEEPIWLEHYEQFVKTGKHPECERRKEE